eukprot:GHVH01002622.1.p1 GENE.GHVH01002622.1~~GHVH01002622.1.p1  ORF type:complete len:484 (+),score=58.68 GHVH01002622.1:128-1453(+)
MDCYADDRQSSPEYCFAMDARGLNDFQVKKFFPNSRCQPIYTSNCVYCYESDDLSSGYCIDALRGNPSSSYVRQACVFVQASELSSDTPKASRFNYDRLFTPCDHYGSQSTEFSRFSDLGTDFVYKDVIQVSPEEYRRLYQSPCPSWTTCEQCVTNSNQCDLCGWCISEGDALMHAVLLLSDMWNYERTKAEEVDTYFHLGDLMVGTVLMAFGERTKNSNASHEDIKSDLEGYDGVTFNTIQASKIFNNTKYCDDDQSKTAYCGAAIQLIPKDIRPSNPLDCSQTYHLAKTINFVMSAQIGTMIDQDISSAITFHDFSAEIGFTQTLDIVGPLESIGFCTDFISSPDFFHSSCYGGWALPVPSQKAITTATDGFCVHSSDQDFGDIVDIIQSALSMQRSIHLADAITRFFIIAAIPFICVFIFVLLWGLQWFLRSHIPKHK